MVEPFDDFRRFEEMMNRMFENFWGRKTTRRFLPSGERGAVVSAEKREPFIDVMESDKTQLMIENFGKFIPLLLLSTIRRKL
jgi:HSP20 family protein